ncbi:MAG TPA: ATP-binding protein, partial [Myxococcaceae bacterium]
MGLPRFPRIEDLLGARLDNLEEKHLQAVVGRSGTDPVREDADLDFKEALYAESRQADLAADVAAMANSRGGVLLIGIGGNDIAAILSPVQVTDAEERRMRQIIADRVFPRPDYEIAAIPIGGSPDQGVFVIAIPKSPFAPHAARDGGLRYYVRDGARNRPLSESEIADAYKNRFELARAQADRLSEVDAEAIENYPHIETWLRLSLVPTIPGSMP